MPKDNLGKPYDFDFIVKSLGLTPIIRGVAALNVGAITDMKARDQGGFTVYVHGDRFYDLDDDQAVELEALLKIRIEEGKADYAENVEFQMRTQQEIGQRVQAGLSRAKGIIDTGGGAKRPWSRS